MKIKEIVKEVVSNYINSLNQKHNDLLNFPSLIVKDLNGSNNYENSENLLIFNQLKIIEENLKKILGSNEKLMLEEFLIDLNVKKNIADLVDILFDFKYAEEKSIYPEGLQKIIDSIDLICNELNCILKNEYFSAELQSFYNDLESSDYDVHIISIGCCGRKEQQVYPWILAIAKIHPEIKFKIDLFDDFYQDGYFEPLLSESSRKGVPDVILHDIYAKTNCWEKLAKSEFSFKHKELNIFIDTHNIYFPNDEFLPLIATKMSKKLLNTVQQLLAANKLVIFSQHTGGGIIDKSLIELFNLVNKEKFLNCENLFIFGENLFKEVNIYNQTIIDLSVFHPAFSSINEQDLDVCELFFKEIFAELSNDVNFDIDKLSIMFPKSLRIYEAYQKDQECSLKHLIKDFLEYIKKGRTQFSSIKTVSFNINPWLDNRKEKLSITETATNQRASLKYF